MNYQILAKKWRPQLFSEVIEQKYIISAISNSFLLNRIHHTWMFCGTRGTGKTTIARLLAKSLNCELGISVNPCRKCINCIEIEQGNFIDLHEVDAASRTKVEDIKELLDNIPYLPTKGRFKIYLIDEVHMLSKHSFNALLKVIEEPPKHIKFIFATTNSEKIPNTVLSRCLFFQLTPISLNGIIGYISKILSEENILYEQKAIEIISRHSEGSLRDAINFTEQLISIGNQKITDNVVRTILNMLNDDQILYILIALLNKNVKNVTYFLKTIYELDINWENILTEILKLLHQISICQICPESLENNYCYSEIRKEEIYKISKIIKYDDIYLYYHTILIGKKELSISPTQKIGAEMTLLRALNLKTTPTNIDINVEM